jgi:hypothetical protein
MAQISIVTDQNERGNELLILKKARGKINLSEIEDLLRYENGGQYQGQYIIAINATENTCGAQWEDGLEEKGDTVVLQLVELDWGFCPVCGKEMEG